MKQPALLLMVAMAAFATPALAQDHQPPPVAPGVTVQASEKIEIEVTTKNGLEAAIKQAAAQLGQSGKTEAVIKVTSCETQRIPNEINAKGKITIIGCGDKPAGVEGDTATPRTPLAKVLNTPLKIKSPVEIRGVMIENMVATYFEANDMLTIANSVLHGRNNGQGSAVLAQVKIGATANGEQIRIIDNEVKDIRIVDVESARGIISVVRNNYQSDLGTDRKVVLLKQHSDYSSPPSKDGGATVPQKVLIKGNSFTIPTSKVNASVIAIERSDVLVHDNEFTFGDGTNEETAAITLSNSGAVVGGGLRNVMITNNRFGARYGVINPKGEPIAPTSVTVHQNDFSTSTGSLVKTGSTGVQSVTQDCAAIDATNNFWGTKDLTNTCAQTAPTLSAAPARPPASPDDPQGVSNPPIVQLPQDIQYFYQDNGVSEVDLTGIRDDKTPLKNLKVRAESQTIQVSTEFEDHWHLIVDNKRFGDVNEVIIEVEDGDGNITTNVMEVWILKGSPWLHPTAKRYGRVNRRIEPIQVRQLENQDPNNVVAIEGLPPGLTYDPKKKGKDDSGYPDNNLTHITGIPTTVGTYPVTQRVKNKKGDVLYTQTFMFEVLPQGAPKIFGSFDIRPRKGEDKIAPAKGDRWRNRFDLPHKSGEWPFSTMSFDVAYPPGDYARVRRNHSRWEVILDTTKATGPTPLKIRMFDREGDAIARWTVVQVDPKKGQPLPTRKLVGIEPKYSWQVGKAITPITVAVDQPDGRDVIEVFDLPQGVTYDPATKQITGTPLAPGTTMGAIAFKDGAGQAQDAKAITFEVAKAPVVPPAPNPQPPAPGPNPPAPQPPAPRPTATPTPSPSVAPAGDVAGLRIAGPSRVETSVAISQQHVRAASQDTIVLARADEVADAVVATPLAHQLNAPVVLTQRDSLHPATAKELKRALKPTGKVVIMGGHMAVSPEVEGALKQQLPGITVERIQGENRFATATAVYARLGSPSAVALVDADKANVGDALVAGVAMAHSTQQGQAAPGSVVFSDGGKVPVETQRILTDTVTQRYTYDARVADEAKAKVIAGNEAVERAIATANTFFGTKVAAIALASATPANTVDALAGGVDAARVQAPLLLTPNNTSDTRVRDYLGKVAKEKTWRTITVYGGTQALSQPVVDGVMGSGVSVKWDIFDYQSR